MKLLKEICKYRHNFVLFILYNFRYGKILALRTKLLHRKNITKISKISNINLVLSSQYKM
ncbi:hypothetical protein TREAZ_2319 [Leadbettera azotonutricia ZAS-9]|uniref:Uncharacterized protein n=1 Tax=Leadbettera azotonutricia (strain ATCC BAA-888 / DSM 13862 / ZAS-9) TaxID=545695 RepID=F5Y7Y9_LEAAZ|nr:hypothetical protein TREAZ_2319 [Leadbettera azotonutricia ZAS-9]